MEIAGALQTRPPIGLAGRLIYAKAAR